MKGMAPESLTWRVTLLGHNLLKFYMQHSNTTNHSYGAGDLNPNLFIVLDLDPIFIQQKQDSLTL